MAQFWHTLIGLLVMATIRKKGDYQWHVQVRKKGYPTQTKTFTTRSDAERWGRETEVEIERGLFFNRARSERATISELIERYREEILPSKRGKGFSPALNQLDAEFGQYALASISSELIAKFRDTRLKSVGAASVKKEINLLSTLIDLAGKEWGIPLAANPCLMVSRPIEPKGRDRRLFEGEEAYLLAACNESSTELAAIMCIAIETGARLGELLKLQWRHINLAKQTARLLDTKNGDDRVIPLSKAAVKELKELPRHIGGRVFNGWAASDSFGKTWKRAVDRARAAYIEDCERKNIHPDPHFLVDLHFHDLRHEAVSRLFEKGLNMMEAASVSGHKTLQMLKRYTHLNAENLAKKLG